MEGYYSHPSARDKHLKGLIQRLGQPLQLAVHGDTQRLEGAGCRMNLSVPVAFRHCVVDYVCQLGGCGYGPQFPRLCYGPGNAA